MRRFVSTVLLVIATLGLGVGWYATSGTAALEEWTVEIAPSFGPPGTEVSIDGFGFGGCDSVWFGWDDGSEGVEPSPGDGGDVHTNILVPDDAIPGTITLFSQCVGEGIADGPTTPFAVIEVPPTPPPAALTIAPARGPTGTRITVAGRDFRCGGPDDGGGGGQGGMAGPSATGPVLLSWAARPGERTEVDVAMNATFQATLVVPRGLAAGQQRLDAECRYGGGTAGATFTVAPLEVAKATPPGPREQPPREDPVFVPPPPLSGTPTASPPTSAPTPSPAPTTPTISPTPPPATTAAPSGVRPISWSALVPTPDRLTMSRLAFVLTSFLAALLILLIAYPAEQFNKTYEENESEIHGTLGRLGVPRMKLSPRAGLAAFAIFSTVLTLLLAAGEQDVGNVIAQFVALVVAMPLVMLAYAAPAAYYLRRTSHHRTVLRILPTALAVAVPCAYLSWQLNLEPPYLYGLFAGFAAVAGQHRKVENRHRAGAVLVGAVSLAALGTVAWFVWSPIFEAAHGTHADWLSVVLDATLFWIVVLSAETLVFALAPLRFLDGHRLKVWNFAAWFLPQWGAALFFWYVLVFRGDLDEPRADLAAMAKALAFFVVFAVASWAFWRYFQWDKRPTREYAETRPTPELTSAP
ncbi:FGLLP motif-containing membrane protein [Actinomycetes bacterium KLBMP 9797]